MPSNLMKQNGSPYYSAVVQVPKDVRHLLGKTAFKKSLKTSDKRIAQAKAVPFVDGWKKLIEAARQGLHEAAESQISMIVADIREMQSLLEKDPEDVHAQAGLDVAHTHLQNLLIKSKGANSFEKLEGAEQEQVINNFKISTGQEHLFLQFLEEHLEYLVVTHRTKESKKQQITRYAKMFPKLQDATRKNVREFMKHLRDDERLTNTTIKRDLSALGVYWDFIRDESLAPLDDQQNPFKEQKPLNNTFGQNAARMPFTKEQLRSLFAKLTTNAAIGDMQDKALLDLSLIALCTGARREEIGQLKIKDIEIGSLHETSCINIRNAKTEAGIRIIPIHPAIMGLVKIRAQNSAAQDSFLFPELSTNRQDLRTDALGKRFGRLKDSLGFGSELVFHSIRKSFTTFMEQAGVPEGVTADIVGHEKQTITYGLYSGGSSNKQKFDAINNIPTDFILEGIVDA